VCHAFVYFRFSEVSSSKQFREKQLAVFFLLKVSLFRRRLMTFSKGSPQCCGSGRIGITLADPDQDRHPGPADPDPYPFQHENFDALPKKLKIFLHI
jgi:hypothetical protein